MPLFTIFQLNFGTVPTVWYILFFILITLDNSWSIKWKTTKNIAVWEQLHNLHKQIEDAEAKWIPPTHTYMPAHFPGFAQQLQLKVERINLFYVHKTPIFFQHNVNDSKLRLWMTALLLPKIRRYHLCFPQWSFIRLGMLRLFSCKWRLLNIGIIWM